MTTAVSGGEFKVLWDGQPPQFQKQDPAPDARGIIGAPIQHLELALVLKVSRAVSGELVLEKLIETLLRTATEHAGAERGLLIVPRGGELSIHTEATTCGTSVMVRLREAPVSAADLPESVVRHAARTQESVTIDDAVVANQFSVDDHVLKHRVRSVLCLPLVTQALLVGVLYLENRIASHVFTPSRVALLSLRVVRGGRVFHSFMDNGSRALQQSRQAEPMRVVLEALGQHAQHLRGAHQRLLEGEELPRPPLVARARGA